MPVPEELAPTAPRILVISQDGNQIAALKRQLEAIAPQVQLEATGNAVEGLMKVGLGCPDALVLDAFIPGVDTREVCRQLRAAPETSQLALVVVSEQASEAKAGFTEVGVHSVLQRPFDAATLLATLPAVAQA